ncbi:hypothetical protein ARMGADRAFT_1086901 [Armillaria gallica]|uniref:Uncharacterized protein n=1 Tax=Armillaria gallica TaxID=47427 RepID=A0A2H3DFA9_ARMGA|nr:hypothetical protein ARMGADRAFT_1086901 [Armillaria gallica]
MTTRSKKQGTQLTATAIDPQIVSQPSSAKSNDTPGSSVETAMVPPHGPALNIIKATVEHESSPLTPAESPPLELNTDVTPGLPGAFNSTEDRRRRVLEKSRSTPIDLNWQTGSNNPDVPTPTSTTVESKPMSDEPQLIAVPVMSLQALYAHKFADLAIFCPFQTSISKLSHDCQAL